MINSGRALSAESLKYLTRSPGNYASSLRWTLWCSNSIFLSHTDESSKDKHVSVDVVTKTFDILPENSGV